MELNTIIPNSDARWNIKNDRLMYNKYSNVPVCYISGNIVYVYIDNRIHNIVMKLTKHLVELGVEFYFDSPSHSDPKITKKNENVIMSYFVAYSNVHFNKGFKNMEFDLLNNMVKWCSRESCDDLIKPCYEDVRDKISKGWFDHYQNKQIYDYSEDIREEFESLYREIQINKIL